MQNDPNTVIYFEQFTDSVSETSGTFDTNAQPDATTNSSSIWSLKYYQKYFDIDTLDIKERIASSVLYSKNDLYRNTIQCRPDIYGPFWISVTLIFSIAISGNFANYLQYTENYVWKYDFHLVSQAAFAILLYVCFVPVLFWSIVQATAIDPLQPLPRVLELLCFYGYSLAIYIPTSILWTIQISFLQWTLVFIATGLSGSVLFKTLSAFFSLSKFKYFLQIGCVFCHLLMAAGFLLHFFHMPDTSNV